MRVPKMMREQFRAYTRAGFTPVSVEQINASHFKVIFAEFSEPQWLTAHVGDPRSIRNNLSRFKRLKEQHAQTQS
jgi:hypothetical protein